MAVAARLCYRPGGSNVDGGRMLARRGKAVAMLSGGLDSTLALKLVLDQGIDVVGVNFSTGFCLTDHAQQVHRKDRDPKSLRNEALRAGADFRIPVEIIDVADEYLDIVKYPKYGYGKNANPCVDCRILMMRRARQFMAEIGADFVFTGEVLGQRPKSQHRRALQLIASESGLADRLVRPLSARLLAPTAPEREGILDRQKLMAFHGRDRRPQIELAARLGVTEWPQPAGGCCYLTDPNYAVLIFDLFAHRGRDAVQREDMILCKVGRHFRLSSGAKVIVGRFEEENNFLRNFGGARARLEARDFTGALTLIDGEVDETALRTAAAVTARYGHGRAEREVVVLMSGQGESRELCVRPLTVQECDALMVR
jgi:tRNA U34 2-thiouridine synthase MnmA/TrmU